jgi:hypothetical protein
MGMDPQLKISHISNSHKFLLYSLVVRALSIFVPATSQVERSSLSAAAVKRFIMQLRQDPGFLKSVSAQTCLLSRPRIDATGNALTARLPFPRISVEIFAEIF